MTTLVTSRLTLRVLRSSDVDPSIALWADPAVTKYMGGPRDGDTIRPLIEEDIDLDDPFMLWPVELTQSGEIVGHCGILEKEIAGKRAHELIYLIAKSHWNCGYATEISTALLVHAKEKLKLGRLVALIDPENKQSSNVVRKLGFSFEASIERDAGVFKDLYGLALK